MSELAHDVPVDTKFRKILDIKAKLPFENKCCLFILNIEEIQDQNCFGFA